MKVVFLLEAGIPSYRNFLFDYINKHPDVSDFLVLHTDRIYNGKEGNYKDKKVTFIGSNKLGLHIGVWKYLLEADVIVSSYNLRIISCWFPALFFRKKWVFWGKGLGEVESFLVFFLRRITAGWCKFLLVYNEVKRREIIEKLNVNKDKVIAYQNTVLIEHPFDHQSDAKECFLYFGRIQERKGLIELIRAYKAYIDRVEGPKFRLRIVGNGQYKDTLRDEVERLKIIEWVDFFPGVYDEKSIKDHFKIAAFYVSPFNVGLGVINSFAYGVPVLTCKSPQVGPEFYYLNETNSVVVENVSQFSDVFLELDQNGFKKYNAFEYYNKSLHHTIMLDNFINTLLKVRDEQN